MERVPLAETHMHPTGGPVDDCVDARDVSGRR